VSGVGTAPDGVSAPVPDTEPEPCGEPAPEERSGFVVHESPSPPPVGGVGFSDPLCGGSAGATGPSLGGGGGAGSLGGGGCDGGSAGGFGVVSGGGPPVGGAGGAGTSSARAAGTAMLRNASTSAISARPRTRDRRPRFEVANPGPKECNWCVETP
jgi:hypothetical protein